jgi:uncharacterized Zn-binding protein involved in type VI secretion
MDVIGITLFLIILVLILALVGRLIARAASNSDNPYIASIMGPYCGAAVPTFWLHHSAAGGFWDLSSAWPLVYGFFFLPTAGEEPRLTRHYQSVASEYDDKNPERHMSAEIIRVGDPTDHGGVVLDGIPGTDLYGLPIAGIGNMVMCPKCGDPFPIIEGTDNDELNGVKVALCGMKTACGAVLIAGDLRTQVSG